MDFSTDAPADAGGRDVPFPHCPPNDTPSVPVQTVSCYCGTRLTIAMLPGMQRECLCGAMHEVTDRGVRIL